MIQGGLKYGKQKTHDIEEIAHYAELAWTMSNGKIMESELAE